MSMGTGRSHTWMIQVVLLIGLFARTFAQAPPASFPPTSIPTFTPPTSVDGKLQFTPDIVVAQDGTGDFLTVMEAVDYAPENDLVEQTTIILIKPGIYNEQVFIAKDKKYITMVGYPGRSIITNNYNALTPNPKYDPTKPTLGFQRPNGDPLLNSLINDTTNRPFIGTANSATFIVKGNGFTGIGLTFENTFGPTSPIRKFAMAPAFRAMADKVLLQYCSFLGFQDTLYAHRGVQLYRNCYITGSIDFIFGYARAWFQNCVIEAKGPPGYPGTICAQARTSLLNYDGFVILDSYIRGYGKANLGRAWRNFSTVLYANNYMEDVINPAGWNDFGFPVRQLTVKFQEYNNRGPGANLTGRVSYSKVLTDDEAAKYLNESFLKLDTWYREPPPLPAPFSYPQPAIPLSPPPFAPPFVAGFPPPGFNVQPPPPGFVAAFPPPGLEPFGPTIAPAPDPTVEVPIADEPVLAPTSIAVPEPPAATPVAAPPPPPPPPLLISSRNNTKGATAVGSGWRGTETVKPVAIPSAAIQATDNPSIIANASMAAFPSQPLGVMNLTTTADHSPPSGTNSPSAPKTGSPNGSAVQRPTVFVTLCVLITASFCVST